MKKSSIPQYTSPLAHVSLPRVSQPNLFLPVHGSQKKLKSAFFWWFDNVQNDPGVSGDILTNMTNTQRDLLSSIFGSMTLRWMIQGIYHPWDVSSRERIVQRTHRSRTHPPREAMSKKIYWGTHRWGSNWHYTQGRYSVEPGVSRLVPD